jgi:6-pyruvoyltetrahydropterin/6-carboxytetrahydropterin synthase
MSNFWQTLSKEVENQFDHKNLNLDVSEFENLNPTAENIAVIWNKSKKRIEAV